MKSLIKQLQDGEIAVKNDGSLKDLIRVLKAAFPKDKGMPFGKSPYYGTISGEAWLGFDKTDLPSYSTAEFIKEIDMKGRTITPEQAQSIIDIACSTWKGSLSEEWATDIVLKQDITISEEMYKRMRNACTGKQHRLFDEIFGKNEEHYPDGTPCLVREYEGFGWNFRYADGKGMFYDSGKKSGEATAWTYHMKLDMNNLPVNE